MPKRIDPAHRRVPLPLRVPPHIRAALQRRAALLGVSVSRAAEGVLERGLADIAREEGGGQEGT